jgi:hypothetical protein
MQLDAVERGRGISPVTRVESDSATYLIGGGWRPEQSSSGFELPGFICDALQ